jgi:hypothetical protein
MKQKALALSRSSTYPLPVTYEIWKLVALVPCPPLTLLVRSLFFCILSNNLTLHLISVGTLHWKISKSSLSNSEIQYNLSGAKDRQFRAWSLPAGVSYEQMAEHWDTLKFGPSSKDVAYKSSYVRAPGKNIEQLRELARSGRDETQRLMAENAGKGKIVWGVPEELAAQDLEPKEELESGVGDIEALVTSGQDDSPPAVVPGEVTDSDLERTNSDNLPQEVVPEFEELAGGLDCAEVVADETISANVQATDDSLSVDPTADSSAVATTVLNLTDVVDDVQKGVPGETPAADTSEVTFAVSGSHDVAQEVTEGKEDAIYQNETQASIDHSDPSITKDVPEESAEHKDKSPS